MNKILVIGKDYYPDNLGVSKYTTEFVEWLDGKNHNISVITGHPYYPDWKYKGNGSSLFYYRETINKINVIRVPLYIPTRPNGLGRVLQNISFAIFIIPVLLYFIILKKPSSMISIVPSYSNSMLVILLGKLFRIQTIIHVQDLEFDLAQKLNLLPRIVCRQLFIIERIILTQANIVSSISVRMLNEIKNKIKKDIPAILFPNWIDKASIYPDRKIGRVFRESLNICKDDFVILYSGNIGYKQGFDVIIKIAEKLGDNDKVKLLIVGSGAGVKDFLNIIYNKRLSNIIYKKPVEVNTLNKLLNTADLHIVLQKEGIDNYILPSKITNILGVGGHALVAGSANSEISDLISKYPGIMHIFDTKKLDDCISKIYEMIHHISSNSVNNIALEYANQNLNKEIILANFSSSIKPNF